MSTPEEYLERGVEELYKAYQADRELGNVNIPEQHRQLLVMSAEEYDRKSQLLFRLSVGDQTIVETPPGFIQKKNPKNVENKRCDNQDLQTPNATAA